MPSAPTRDEVAALARQAGLDLPDAYLEQLVGAYGNVRRMIDAIPHNRPRGDEPAHVFVPETFLPEGR
ncbi:hypothetical protein [Rhodopila sp.]|uniref:hypothetical protein n=1 Tax=Rhodopila sp. TaxID=2480087 RepID=UPI003D0B1462